MHVNVNPPKSIKRYKFSPPSPPKNTVTWITPSCTPPPQTGLGFRPGLSCETELTHLPVHCDHLLRFSGYLNYFHIPGQAELGFPLQFELPFHFQTNLVFLKTTIFQSFQEYIYSLILSHKRFEIYIVQSGKTCRLLN